eukprot:4776335-Ditylum_brightwellii.AAC.1
MITALTIDSLAIGLILTLLSDHADKLHELLCSFSRSQYQCSQWQWQHFLDALCSIAPAVPGGLGLLSTLQAALPCGKGHT